MLRDTLRFVCLIAVLGMALPLFAADAKAELQQRFKDRLPEIDKLKAEGKLGERWDGYAEAVKDTKLDEKAQKLVSAENADRKELYGLIAAAEPGATVEMVGQRNAERYLRLAKKGDWFKLKSGEWKQKE